MWKHGGAIASRFAWTGVMDAARAAWCALDEREASAKDSEFQTRRCKERYIDPPSGRARSHRTPQFIVECRFACDARIGGTQLLQYGDRKCVRRSTCLNRS